MLIQSHPLKMYLLFKQVLQKSQDLILLHQIWSYQNERKFSSLSPFLLFRIQEMTGFVEEDHHNTKHFQKFKKIAGNRVQNIASDI